MTIFSHAFERLRGGESLSRVEADELMSALVADELSELQIASLLAGLEVRGPRPAELAGFAAALDRHLVALPDVPEGTIDTCGTGGAPFATLNTSTLAALVAAAAGATVAKHGNRSASGRCGSLDVLEALGARIDLSPARTSAILRAHRFTFLNARAHHPVLARVGPLRRQLGFRTVFNLLGPILSPARVRRQLVGVSDRRAAPIIAESLAQSGRERAWVVHGPGGLDELGLGGPTSVWSVERGQVHRFALDPSALGLAPDPRAEAARGGDRAHNAARFQALLEGDPGPAADHVILNAAAALTVAEITPDLPSGLEAARHALASGAARDRFHAWRAATTAAPAREERL